MAIRPSVGRLVRGLDDRLSVGLLADRQEYNYLGVGKMRNCGMRKVKCGIQKCGNVCGTVGKMRNALLNGLKTALRFKAK